MRYFTLPLVLVSIAISTVAFSQRNLPEIQKTLISKASEYGLKPDDLKELEIAGSASSKAKSVQYIYVRQLKNGVPVVNGIATITLKNNKVLNVASRLKTNLNPDLSAQTVSAEQAIKTLFEQKTGKFEGQLLAKSSENNNFKFENKSISNRLITAGYVYLATEAGLVPCWNISLAEKSGEHWWSARISAITGNIIEINDWIKSCSFGNDGNCAVSEHNHIQNAQMLLPPPGADQYRVYALPVESPNHGNRSLLINPSDIVSSPFGWHDTDGQTGDEYTITRGNNVYATEDINDDDEPGYSPDGGTALNFDFIYDSLAGVQGNLDAVITNLFYMNNMMHDIWFHYGFDEESGNFQQTNYSGAGLGDDFVFAQAQDGSGTNNANFGTPPDGEIPSMQMYIWSESNVLDQLTVNAPASIAGNFVSSTAGFGPPLPTVPITENVVLVDDGVGVASDGCQTILNGQALSGKIALVRRGSCTFAQKVEACEAEGAVAVIVMNNTGGTPTAMGGTSTTNIPSVMISQNDGTLFEQILENEALNATLVKTSDLGATDSDFDNMIIAHEYGHGISTRLTGGADNSDCLNNEEQMGEGWSDWFGLMITQKAGDLAASPRGVGTYVTNQPTTGDGIRPAPYSTSFTVNNYTYFSTNSPQISQPHGIGFIWASMLWDLNWALIDEYGFDADIKNGNGGNNRAMSLVIEGLKLQPCAPGFVDGRDAILMADELLYDGANKCLIWEVFARRGLGFNADQGSSDSRSDQTQDFNVHPSCLGSGVGLLEKSLEMVQVYPNPATDVLTVDMSNYTKVVSIRITDLQGKVLYENNNVNQSIVKLDVSTWKSGIYLVNLADANGAKAVQVMRR